MLTAGYLIGNLKNKIYMFVISNISEKRFYVWYLNAVLSNKQVGSQAAHPRLNCRHLTGCLICQIAHQVWQFSPAPPVYLSAGNKHQSAFTIFCSEPPTPLQQLSTPAILQPHSPCVQTIIFKMSIQLPALEASLNKAEKKRQNMQSKMYITVLTWLTNNLLNFYSKKKGTCKPYELNFLKWSFQRLL